MEDINIHQVMPQDHSIVSDPYFLAAMLAVIILTILSTKLFFTNTKSEYIYDPHHA